MQLQSERSNRLDDIRTQFRAREGHYRLMNSPDYFRRPHRNIGNSSLSQNGSVSSGDIERCEKTWIKISLVTVNDNNDPIVGIKQRSHPCDQNSADNNRSLNGRRGKCIRDRKLCFNIGLELFVYNYDGVRYGPNSSGPILKKTFKNNTPICHDFNQATATSSSIRLLVGLSQGQIQLIDFSSDGHEKEENFKEFNSDRMIDKTRVTCIRWLPNSPSLFLAGHASGNLYLYKDDVACGPAAPVYQVYKQSGGVIVYTCKTKTIRNPIYKWVIGSQQQNPDGSTACSLGSSTSLHNVETECYSLNDFVFSPCAKYLACVSQDGFLRVFCYDTMEVLGKAKSYYGGLTCVCWSPDGRYVVSGGEDDLVTIWSFVERRVVARGMGHKSWVSVVCFDSFYTGDYIKDTDVDNYDDEDDDRELGDIFMSTGLDDEDEDEILSYNQERFISQQRNSRNLKNVIDGTSPSKTTVNNDEASHGQNTTANLSERVALSDRCASNPITPTTYRFGSVSHDTQLCLWDLSDDLMNQSISKSKICPTTQTLTNSYNGTTYMNLSPKCEKKDSTNHDHDESDNIDLTNGADNANKSNGFLNLRGSSLAKSFSLIGKRDKRNVNHRTSSAGVRPSTTSDTNCVTFREPQPILGSPMCPRMNEVPVIQPLVCKKISYERLTSLIFLKGGFITSCQDGYIYSWARP